MKAYRWKDYEKRVWGICHSFHTTTSVELDELFGEACIAFVKAVQTYDKSKDVNLNTWATKLITNALITFTNKIQKDRAYRASIELYATENGITTNSEHETIESQIRSRAASIFDITAFKELMLSTDELSAVYHIILDSPTEFLDLPPKYARGHMRRKLLRLGMTFNQVRETMRQLRGILETT